MGRRVADRLQMILEFVQQKFKLSVKAQTAMYLLNRNSEPKPPYEAKTTHFICSICLFSYLFSIFTEKASDVLSFKSDTVGIYSG